MYSFTRLCVGSVRLCRALCGPFTALWRFLQGLMWVSRRFCRASAGLFTAFGWGNVVGLRVPVQWSSVQDFRWVWPLGFRVQPSGLGV